MTTNEDFCPAVRGRDDVHRRDEMPWLKGRDLERVMGGAVVDWLGWRRPAKG